MSAYRSVLAIPGSPRLFASAIVGRLPQGMAPLAIVLLVRGTTHSYAAAGAATGAFALATATAAPLQGRLVDRIGRMRVLAPAGIGQGLLLVLLVLLAKDNGSVGALVVVCGLAGALLPPIAASVRALLREVVPDHGMRESAYALDSVAQEVIWITGPLIVALIVGLTNPSDAVLVVAAVCVAGTATFVSSPLARDHGRRAERGRRTAAIASPTLRRLLGPILLTGTGLGAIEIGLPSLALHAGSRWASGLLLALWSVGSMAGGLWYGSRPWRSPIAIRYRMLLLVAALFTVPLIGARSVPAGVVCSLLAGLTIAPMFSCQYALVGRAVTAGSETEAFTWVSASLIGGIAAGSAAGGAVIASGGVGAPFILSCVATTTAAALALRVREAVAA
jgi:MFS family permease